MNSFGKESHLLLETAVKDGNTIIENVSFTAPFKIMKPFSGNGGEIRVMQLSASAGIMAGDRQSLEFHIKNGSKVSFLSQSFEKVHKMEDGYAQKKVRIQVEDGAEFRYLPLPVILFGGSDFRGDTEVELEGEASRFVMSEIIASGRNAYKESFAYRLYENQVEIRNQGKLVYRDRCSFEPQKMDMTGYGMYEGYTHLCNLIICNYPVSEGLLEIILSEMEGQEMEGGVTRVGDDLIVFRIFGHQAQQLQDFQEFILSRLNLPGQGV